MRPVTVTNGELVQWLPVGDLAAVLGRSVGRVRALESRGVLPPALKRRRVDGGLGHWRLYPLPYVLELGRIAEEEGVTSRQRVSDWSSFSARAWAAYDAARATAGGNASRRRD